ncbi:hypothetical protein DFH06DRAFT_1142899 [Mycena polygramma]|nr:hypothetical protein DFH06DRAFT_1142899 [Mycena polygramma]
MNSATKCSVALILPPACSSAREIGDVWDTGSVHMPDRSSIALAQYDVVSSSVPFFQSNLPGAIEVVAAADGKAEIGLLPRKEATWSSGCCSPTGLYNFQHIMFLVQAQLNSALVEKKLSCLKTQSFYSDSK